MKRTRRPETRRDPLQLEWKDIVSENSFEIEGTLPSNQAVSLINVDLFRGHIKSREAVRLYHAQDRNTTQDVMMSFTWIPEDAPDKEYLICQTVSGFEYRDINDISDTWKYVEDYNFYADTLVGTWTGTGTANITAAAGKLYVFQEDANSIFEWVDVGGGRIRRRSMGMGRPSISTLVLNGAPSSPGAQDPGEYLYAVEYCYRKNIGTSAEADFVTSTPQRRFLSRNGTLCRATVNTLGQGIDIAAGTYDAEADKLWTHIKLYRTKKLDASSTTDIVEGSEDTFYSIQLIDRATFLGSGFATDILHDDELPTISSGAEVVNFSATSPDLDQEVIPPGKLGIYHGNKIWVVGSGDSTGNKTEMYHTSPGFYKYAEQYHPTQVYNCSTADGGEITNLVSLEEDLLVFKEAQTGRVPYGDPQNTYDILDPEIGVPGKAIYVPKIGVVGLTNNLSDLMIFTRGLTWSSYLNGVPFSKPVRGLFEAVAAGRPGVPGKTLNGITFYKGKLLVVFGYEVWAFHADEQLGWTHYSLPHLTSGLQIKSITTDMLGLRCLMCFEGLDDTHVFTDRDLADADGSYPESRITSYGFQVDGGRGVIEQRYMSLMAKLTNAATMSVYLGNRTDKLKDVEPFALTPINTTLPSSTMAEYQYYAAPNYPARTKIYADRLYYEIITTGYAEFRDLRFYGYSYVGMRPPLVTDQSQQNIDTAQIAEVSQGQIHWQTNPDMSIDRMDPLDPNQPFQEINFILMVAE